MGLKFLTWCSVAQSVCQQAFSLLAIPCLMPPSFHYGDIIMGTMASQITSLTTVYSTFYSDADKRKHRSSTSMAFGRGIHLGPVNSPHKWPVTRKMFPFDNVIMLNPGLTRRRQLVSFWFKITSMCQSIKIQTTNICMINCIHDTNNEGRK